MNRPSRRLSFILGLILILGLSSIFFFSKNESPSSELISYRQFLKSVGADELSKDFIAHRSQDTLFLKRVRQFLQPFQENASQNNVSQNIKYPKIIHQIWLYDLPPPEEVAYLMQMIQAKNPSFQYILWTKEMVRNRLQKEFGTNIEYLQDTISIADYVASLVLLEQGGIVIDPWCEQVATLENILVPSSQLTIGVEPPQAKIQVGNRRLFFSPAVIASVPHHPLIRLWKKELKLRLSSFTLPFYEGWNSSKNYDRMVWISLGSLTDVILSTGKSADRIIPMGPSWWCPIRPRQIKAFYRRVSGEGHRSPFQKFKETFHVGLPLFSDIRSQTVLIHLTGGRLGMKEDKVQQLFHMNPYQMYSNVNRAK